MPTSRHCVQKAGLLRKAIMSSSFRERALGTNRERRCVHGNGFALQESLFPSRGTFFPCGDFAMTDLPLAINSLGLAPRWHGLCIGFWSTAVGVMKAVAAHDSIFCPRFRSGHVRSVRAEEANGMVVRSRLIQQRMRRTRSATEGDVPAPLTIKLAAAQGHLTRGLA